MINSRDYEVCIKYSAEEGDGCFIASVRDWHGMKARGDSREAAAREIQIALDLAVETSKERNLPLPEPNRVRRMLKELNEQEAAKRGEIGIPLDAVFSRLLFIAERQLLIAELISPKSKSHVARLFYRKTNERRYHELERSTTDESHMFAVAVPSRPLAVYSVWTEGGQNWDSLRVLDLETFQTQLLFSKGQFQVPPEYTGGWILQLHGIDPELTECHCVGGFFRERQDGGSVEYFLTRLDLKSGNPELLSRLEATVF